MRCSSVWGAERSYGQKLAEEMEINPGQMSRILVTLFNYGFLTREQEQSRYYYTTNKESISAFFRQAQQLLTGRAGAVTVILGLGLSHIAVLPPGVTVFCQFTVFLRGKHSKTKF
ncbi:MAG: hypothetical protein ACLSHU_07630 [Oscillospiraceae bacterium]